MSRFTHSPKYLARSVAISALMATTFLIGPVTAARADSTPGQPLHLVQNAPAKTAATDATETKGETVEQRITNLHAALKITPEEESKWNGVAQAMRENAAAMDKLVASDRTTRSAEQ